MICGILTEEAEMKYIVKSGNSYVADVDTLEMIGSCMNISDVAMRAARMSLEEATDVRSRMAGCGLVASIVEINVGKLLVERE